MVKSKKMSKTSIAVIVLAILLVLSMIMGMTGAWFTDSDSGSITGGTATFTLGDFLQLNVTNPGTNAAASLYRQGHDENNALTEYASIAGTVAMPGDQIRVAGGATISVTATEEGDAERDFWYVYRVDGGAWTDAAVGNTADFHLEVSLNPEDAAMSGDLATNGKVTKSGATFQILGLETTNEYKGQSVTITFDNISIEVRAMQYENVSATAANSYLKDANYAEHNNPTPANEG